MPIIFLFLGALILAVAYQGTEEQFITLLKGDFTGQNNFAIWAIAILIVGALGAIPDVGVLADWFLALIIVAILLSHQGFFSQILAQVKSGTNG